MGRAFEGIRVIDFSQVISGPYLTLQLALEGADVVKVEPPGQGDQMRNRMLPSPHAARSMASPFLALNHGKRSLALDLKEPRGLAVALKLVEGADVLVHNFRGGVADRLGIGWEAVRRINPRLVYCAVSGYGSTGPRATEAAYDGAIQAASGLMANNGHRETGPTRTGYFPVDVFAGMTGAYAVAAALFRRERTGEGQCLDVAMLDGALALQATAMGQYLVDGNPGGLIGNSSATRLPTADCFPTADGLLLMSATQQHQIAPLFREAGIAELLDDPRFVDNKARAANAAAVRAAIVEALARDSAASWERRLGPLGVPVAKVRSLAEALAEPALAHRGIVVEVPPPQGFAAPLRLPGAAYVAASDGPAAGGPPPALGEHGRQVLGEAGLGADEIAALIEAGVVGTSA